MQGLLANAAQARAAAEAGDLARLGACLSLYWEQKKIMADGGEPAAVTIMMDALRAADLVHGLTLGGGVAGVSLWRSRNRHEPWIAAALP